MMNASLTHSKDIIKRIRIKFILIVLKSDIPRKQSDWLYLDNLIQIHIHLI